MTKFVGHPNRYVIKFVIPEHKDVDGDIIPASAEIKQVRAMTAKGAIKVLKLQYAEGRDFEVLG